MATAGEPGRAPGWGMRRALLVVVMSFSLYCHTLEMDIENKMDGISHLCTHIDSMEIVIENEWYCVFRLRTSRAVSRCFHETTKDHQKEPMTQHFANNTRLLR
jgi:hypothetical protein